MKTILYSCTALQLMMFAAVSPSYGMENDTTIEATDSNHRTINVKVNKYVFDSIKESLMMPLDVSMEDLEVAYISVVCKKPFSLSKEKMDDTRLNFMTSLAENNDEKTVELIRYVGYSPIADEKQKAEAQTWNTIFTQKVAQSVQIKELQQQALTQSQILETSHTSDLIVDNLLSKKYGNALELTSGLANTPKKEKAELWRSQILEEMEQKPVNKYAQEDRYPTKYDYQDEDNSQDNDYGDENREKNRDDQ